MNELHRTHFLSPNIYDVSHFKVGIMHICTCLHLKCVCALNHTHTHESYAHTHTRGVGQAHAYRAMAGAFPKLLLGPPRQSWYMWLIHVSRYSCTCDSFMCYVIHVYVTHSCVMSFIYMWLIHVSCQSWYMWLIHVSCHSCTCDSFMCHVIHVHVTHSCVTPFIYMWHDSGYFPRTWISCSHMVVETLLYCTRKCGRKGGCMSASCFLQPPRNGSTGQVSVLEHSTSTRTVLGTPRACTMCS